MSARSNLSPSDPSRDLAGRAFITIDEAAAVFGVSVRTARRWAADYVASGGARGIPVVQVTERRRLVPVAKLLDLMGTGPSEGPDDQAEPGS